MERRKHKRIKYMRKVTANMNGSGELAFDVLDYSMGGMALVGKNAMSEGDVLHLQQIMTLDGDSREMDMNARICHVKKQFEEYAMGVEFI